MMQQSATEDLAGKLEQSGHYRLFGLPDSRRRIDDLWNEPDAPERLLRLATDDSQSWLARFLAAEVIFSRQMFLLLHRPELFASLARVYANALTENASGFMSHWGFKDSMNDSGILGGRFIVFGPDSDAALRPLLDESRQVPYSYPPEFPFRMRPGFRVQDFAAQYLGKIHGIPLQLTEDPAQRDVEISRLKLLLP